MIYAVRYKEDDTLEGYVESQEAFDQWLTAHNKQRTEEGEVEEYAHEFELIELRKL